MRPGRARARDMERTSFTASRAQARYNGKIKAVDVKVEAASGIVVFVCCCALQSVV